MSESADTRLYSKEEGELRNLLTVRDTIDDVFHEIDAVVKTTETDLLYVSAHQINDNYSKLLDELLEVSKTSSNSDEEDNLIRMDVSRCTRMVEDVGKDEELQLCSKTLEKPQPLASLGKTANFEPPTFTESSISSQKTKACGENQRCFSKLDESPLHSKKSDVGIKRPLLPSPKEDHKVNENVCKKLKADIPNDLFNLHTIHQERPINMDRKLARKNFRGPASIPTDSIAVILDTKKPSTSYQYPVRKPEYRFSHMSATRLKKSSQNISVTVYSTKEYRKIITYPYSVDDYIELTDTFLTQELDEEYKRIVQYDCDMAVDEEHNFLNSPNRIIKLIERSSGSSTEDSSEVKLTESNLNDATFQQNTEQQQEYNNFKENAGTNDNHHVPYQTEQESKDSELFSGIVPLQVQTDIDMLNIRRNSNCEEEHLTQLCDNSSRNNSLERSDPISGSKSYSDDYSVSSSQLINSTETLSDIDKKIEFILSEMPVKLTPSASPVARTDALMTNFELLNDEHKDQNELFLEIDDAEGKNSMTICTNKTFSNESVNITDVSEKIERNSDSKVLPIETLGFNNDFNVIAGEINVEEMNAIDIERSFYSDSEDCVGNNFKQMNEAHDNSFFCTNSSSISTITAKDDFDSDNGSLATGSFKTACNCACGNSDLELCTDSKGGCESFVNIQNSLPYNESLDVVNKESVSCNHNASGSVMVVAKSFKFSTVAAATLKNTEDIATKSLDSQDEELIIDSDSSSTSDESEFKNQNTAKLISSTGSDCVSLLNSYNKENVSSTTGNAKERDTATLVHSNQSKVFINLVNPDDFSSDFIPLEQYKIESDNEDIINISDSSIGSNNQLENISKYEFNQNNSNFSESRSSSLNFNPTIVSKTITERLLNEAEIIIDLDSSLDSVISINTNEALASSEEESITRPFSQEQNECKNINITVGISSNHNTDHGINVKKNIGDKNQIVNISGNIKTKGSNSFIENTLNKTNDQDQNTATTTISTNTSLASNSGNCIASFNNTNFCCDKNLSSLVAETVINIEADACEDVQKDGSTSTSGGNARLSDNVDMDHCKSEELYMNENCYSKYTNVTDVICEAEDPISNGSYTAEPKNYNLCAISEINFLEEETCADTFIGVNIDVGTGNQATTATVLFGESTLASKSVEEPSNFSNNADVPKTISMQIKNYTNPIVDPKHTVEQTDEQLTSTHNQHCIYGKIVNISPNSSSVASGPKIPQNSDLQHQHDISGADSVPTTNIQPKTSPLPSEQTENTLAHTKTLLELPYINSEIGMRPFYTSHTVPNLDLKTTTQTYVPTININADSVLKCDNANVDLNQNCTITKSECMSTDVCSAEFIKPACDNCNKELELNLEVADLRDQTNFLVDAASNGSFLKNSSPATASLVSQDVLKPHIEVEHNSTTPKPALSTTLTTNANTVTTGVKRPPPASITNESNNSTEPKRAVSTTLTTDRNTVTTGIKRPAPATSESNKRSKSSTTNIKHQALSKTTSFVNNTIDAKEIADNNDPKWKLFNFSEPRDFFLATRSQWCAPMPSPHVDFTRRHCTDKPTHFSHYSIPGDQRNLSVECLRIYEEQLHEINTKSTNLKSALDMHGQSWHRRQINQTLNQLKSLDNMHDMLRDAWDEAYHFYVHSKDSETDRGAWYMSKFNQNEIARSLEIIQTYEEYYGYTD